jgi:hypothetical protein
MGFARNRKALSFRRGFFLRYEVLEGDTSEEELAAQRRQPLIGASRGGIVTHGRRQNPEMLSTPQAELGQKPVPPVRKLEPVKAGDTGFALPFPADYTDEADILWSSPDFVDTLIRHSLSHLLGRFFEFLKGVGAL